MDTKEVRAWSVIMSDSVQRAGSDVWKVKSSDGKKVYSVVRWSSQDLRCECLGFRHYNKCKHIDAVQKMLEIARHNG